MTDINNKVLVSVAPVAATDKVIIPEKIAEDVYQCYKAGASMVHLHVRDREGRLTPDMTLLEETLALIRRDSDIIIEVSTGGVSDLNIQERCAPLYSDMVEACSLNVGSTNLGKDVYCNPIDDVEYCIREILKQKKTPEVETFEIGHTWTMAQLMREEPENRNQYLEQFVDLQLLVHSKRSPLLNKLREKLDRQISTCEALSPNTRFIIRGRLDSMPKHACVLHGDFNPGNIIVSEDGTCHILDWSHATQGNASADAANTYLLLTLEDAETADQYLELYCRKSKTAKHYVQQWLSIAAASRKTKGIPEEEKLLNHWLNVLEYE